MLFAAGRGRNAPPTSWKPLRSRASSLAHPRGNNYNALVKLDRKAITKSTLRAHEDNNFVPGTIEERVMMVWPITREIAALNPDYDVEQRLQRHVVRVTRRGR